MTAASAKVADWLACDRRAQVTTKRLFRRRLAQTLEATAERDQSLSRPLVQRQRTDHPQSARRPAKRPPTPLTVSSQTPSIRHGVTFCYNSAIIT